MFGHQHDHEYAVGDDEHEGQHEPDRPRDAAARAGSGRDGIAHVWTGD
jgi:hypothetical protein